MVGVGPEDAIASFMKTNGNGLRKRVSPVRTSSDGVKYKFCYLCKTKYKESEDHEKSYQHELCGRKVSARMNTILQVRDDARFLPSNIERSLSPNGPWSKEIYAMIGLAIMEEDRMIIEDAKDLLDYYKDLERISLLELAVWKFACFTMDPPEKSRGDEIQ